MNKKYFIIFLLMAILAVFLLGSCLSNQGLDDSHNSKNSLDWAGVYTGTIPSASGMGIDVRMTLNRDQSFELRYEYVDKTDKPLICTGSFQWDEKGSIIILNIKDTPPYYKVAENKLIQLDMQGKPITGKLADDYVLKKNR